MSQPMSVTAAVLNVRRGPSVAHEVVTRVPRGTRVEAGAAERMFARTLAATIGLSEQGETLLLRMESVRRGDRPMLRLSVDRPQAIEGVAEAALLDPGYSPEGDWPGAPALGLGFALRLVRNLAEASGGALLIGEVRVSLYIPAFVPETQAAGQGDKA